MCEHSLARIHTEETNGNLILEQTQSESPPDCESPGCLSVDATGAPALRDPEPRLPPSMARFWGKD